MQGLLTAVAGLSVGGSVIWVLWVYFASNKGAENPPPVGGPDARGVFLMLPGIVAGVIMSLLSYHIQKSGGAIGSFGVMISAALLTTKGVLVAKRLRQR